MHFLLFLVCALTVGCTPRYTAFREIRDYLGHTCIQFEANDVIKITHLAPNHFVRMGVKEFELEIQSTHFSTRLFRVDSKAVNEECYAYLTEESYIVNVDSSIQNISVALSERITRFLLLVPHSDSHEEYRKWMETVELRKEMKFWELSQWNLARYPDGGYSIVSFEVQLRSDPPKHLRDAANGSGEGNCNCM